MLINHVLSSDTYAAPLTRVLATFRDYAPNTARIVTSIEPISGADVYHYHWAQLEPSLREPCVATLHQDVRDPDPHFAADKSMPRYREAGALVCVNRAQQRWLAEHGLEQTRVIPHGCEETLRPREKQARSANKLRLGIISESYERRVRGEPYLHDLAKRLDPSRFCFTIVGERRMRTAAYLLKLGFEARFFEFFPDRMYQSLYDSIDYLLVCSSFAGGPPALADAAATSTPVLALPVGAVPDLIDDGVSGLVLRGDPRIDVERITKLADPRDPLAARIAGGADKTVGRVPTTREVVARYFDIYAELVGGPEHG